MNNINLLICDVDGTLTDGGMYYDDQGHEWKKFNTRDGKGIELLRHAGVKVMLLTAEDTVIVKRRAEKLKVDFCCMGIKNKKEYLEKFYCQNQEYSFLHSAYIGDDINDLEVLKIVGLSAAPADAIQANRDVVDYVCHYKGGAGCVREFCEIILEKQDT